jgi:hypothetical protein
MDPRDVNRINYNNYFVGQNLDFLVRSKMRSESLSTPLKNTPAFYDDQVTSKMSLLGKRGFYDPGYIYGFQNSEQNPNLNEYQGNKNDEYTNPVTREQYDQLILPKEHYREQLLQNYEMNSNNINTNNKKVGNKIYNDSNNIEEEMLYKEKEREKERLEMLKERQTPQKLDNFQLNRINKNSINFESNNNPKNDYKNTINNNPDEKRNEYIPKYPPYFQKEKEEFDLYEKMKYDSGMVRNRDKIPNVDYTQQINEYNYINDIAQKNVGDLVLPPTKNQILQEVYLENFNRKHSPK